MSIIHKQIPRDDQLMRPSFCPYCGSQEIKIWYGKLLDTLINNWERYRITCKNCKVEMVIEADITSRSVTP